MDAKKVNLMDLYLEAAGKEIGFDIDVANDTAELVAKRYEDLAIFTLSKMMETSDLTHIINAIQSFGATVLYQERMGEHK